MQPANTQSANTQRLKLLVTVVDRGKGQTAVDLLVRERVLYHRIVLGHGTATAEILDILGLGDPAKDVVFSVLPSSRAGDAMHRLMRTLQFDNPGHGIAFTISIGSVGGQSTLDFLTGNAAPDPEAADKEEQMESRQQYDLIISIVNNGFADQVMDAALPAGARGGTVVHARGAATQEAERFFGITIQPEKEMVMILAKHDTKRPIMEAVCRAVGMATAGRGVIFSLPVDDVMGLARLMRDEDA